jgi:Rhodanese-like domain
MAKSRPNPGAPKKAAPASSTLVLVIGAILVIALVAFSFSRTMQKPASSVPAPAVSDSQSAAPSAVPESTFDPRASEAAQSFPPPASPREGVVPPTSPAIPGPADAAPTEAQLAAVPRIEPADLLQKIESKQVTLIDVRDVDSYRTRHIPGALQIPLSFIAGEVPYLPKDKPIVTYCT